MENKKLSVVVSVYNEAEALPKMYDRLSRILTESGWDYEILLVNDGSTDLSRAIIYNIIKLDNKAKAIHFSRNFGHEAAMIAGIDYAGGTAIVCMDADMQHPPECLPDMLKAFDEGYDVINMVRTANKSAGLLKNITSSAFYGFINMVSDVKLKKNASDFFGISKRVAEVLRSSYREKIRFLRGFVQSVGFQTKDIEYEAGVRVAGESKYSIKKLFRFSLDTIMYFSDMPLRLGLYAGGFSALIGIIVAIYTIVTWARVGTPSGYATMVVLICFMFTIMFFLIGIIGQYIGILFTEMKDRPIYIVEEKLGFDRFD